MASGNQVASESLEAVGRPQTGSGMAPVTRPAPTRAARGTGKVGRTGIVDAADGQQHLAERALVALLGANGQPPADDLLVEYKGAQVIRQIGRRADVSHDQFGRSRQDRGTCNGPLWHGQR